jgi:hypothetical protein
VFLGLLSSNTDQATGDDTPFGPLTVTVADDETVASDPILTGTSSDTAVMQNGGIAFVGGGTGTGF